MSVGPWQIILILVIVLIIFGAGKLPRVMGDIAKGVRNFKDGLKDEGDKGESGKEDVSANLEEKSSSSLEDKEKTKG